MGIEQQFNLMDYLTVIQKSDEKAYSTPEAVKEQLKALGTQMRELCAENDIPILITFAHGSTDEAYHIAEAHHFLPLHRVPIELILCLIAVKSGAELAVEVVADLLKYAET